MYFCYVETKTELFNDIYADHHEAFAFAEAIKRPHPAGWDVAMESIIKFYHEKLVPHFKEEEEDVFPAITEPHRRKTVDELIYQHNLFHKLINRFNSTGHTKSDVIEFGDLLINHIYLEEGLFKQLSPDPYEGMEMKMTLDGSVNNKFKINDLTAKFNFKLVERLINFVSKNKILFKTKLELILTRWDGYSHPKYNGFKDYEVLFIYNDGREEMPHQGALIEPQDYMASYDKVHKNIIVNVYKLLNHGQLPTEISGNAGGFEAVRSNGRRDGSHSGDAKQQEQNNVLRLFAGRFFHELQHAIQHIEGIELPSTDWASLEVYCREKYGLLMMNDERFRYFIAKKHGVSNYKTALYKEYQLIPTEMEAMAVEQEIYKHFDVDERAEFAGGGLFDAGGSLYKKWSDVEEMSKSDIKKFYESKEGKELDKQTYSKWKSLVNMSRGELQNFYDSQDGKEAGLTASEAKEQGIDSGRESARWIMKMKDTPFAEWTPTMWAWAKKQISFINRMRGVKGGLYDDNGNKTRKHTALLIWGHNPEKYKFEDGGLFDEGGEINENSPYQKKVSANFTHMGTDSKDWKSTPIKGFDVIEVNGKEKTMPTFDFPVGYKNAPTMFPSGKNEPYTCELCGKTPIRTVYWIQNDEKKWSMGVGSECVTHFEEGVSGKDNLRQFKINRAIILDNDLIALSGVVSSKFKTKDSWKTAFVGAGSSVESIDKANALIVAGELDALFDTKKGGFNSSGRKDNIYWRFVYNSIPVFGYEYEMKNKEGYGKTKEGVEKDLLTWYKRNEQKAVSLIGQIKKVLISLGYINETDYNSEYMDTKTINESQMDKGGEIADIKLQIMRLQTKAFKMFANSPQQLKVRAEIDRLYRELQKKQGSTNFEGGGAIKERYHYDELPIEVRKKLFWDYADKNFPGSTLKSEQWDKINSYLRVGVYNKDGDVIMSEGGEIITSTATIGFARGGEINIDSKQQELIDEEIMKEQFGTNNI